MRTICSWCGAVIADGPAEPVSHGICRPCRRRLIVDDDERLLTLEPSHPLRRAAGCAVMVWLIALLMLLTVLPGCTSPTAPSTVPAAVQPPATTRCPVTYPVCE